MPPNKYINSILLGFASFTVTMLGLPSENVHSQDADTIKNSQSQSVPAIDTSRVLPRLERIAEKTEELKSNTKIIRENTQENLKRTTRLEKLVDRISRPAPDDPEPDPVVILVPADTQRIYLSQSPRMIRDTSLDKKTWWGKFFATNRRMMKDCKLHKVFRRNR